MPLEQERPAAAGVGGRVAFRPGSGAGEVYGGRGPRHPGVFPEEKTIEIQKRRNKDGKNHNVADVCVCGGGNDGLFADLFRQTRGGHCVQGVRVPGRRHSGACPTADRDSLVSGRASGMNSVAGLSPGADYFRGHSPTSMSRMSAPSITSRTAVRTLWKPYSPAAPGLTCSRS